MFSVRQFDKIEPSLQIKKELWFIIKKNSLGLAGLEEQSSTASIDSSAVSKNYIAQPDQSVKRENAEAKESFSLDDISDKEISASSKISFFDVSHDSFCS